MFCTAREGLVSETTLLTARHRVRYQVQNARALDFSVESKKLADMISKYSLQENSLFVN